MQRISHHWHVTAGAVLYYVQVNNFVSYLYLLKGGLNCCFHKHLVYPAKSFSGLGLVLIGPVVKSLTVMKFLTWLSHQSSFLFLRFYNINFVVRKDKLCYDYETFGSIKSYLFILVYIMLSFKLLEDPVYIIIQELEPVHSVCACVSKQLDFLF